MKLEIEVKQTSVTYSDTLKITGISYSTTLPTNIPPEDALQIFKDFITDKMQQTISVNGGNKIIGKLASLTEDKVQQHYCFSVNGMPKLMDERFTITVKIDI